MAEASVNIPNIAYLVKVMLSLAVTSASTECAKSTLILIKSKLRFTIARPPSMPLRRHTYEEPKTLN